MKSKEEIIKAFNEAKFGEGILSNNIKKGDLIVEAHNWYGEIIDNKKGNIRMANIHGLFEEMGSIYVWNITRVCKDGVVYYIKLTKKQKKDKKMINVMGF